jgi:hypothetical protein
MSNKLERVTRNNRVVAIPSRKRKEEDGSETQLYNVFRMR